MFLRREKRGPSLSDPRLRAVWEALEARKLMSIAPGWSEVVNGFTLSYDRMYPENPDSAGVLTVTGTAGDDVMGVSVDPANAGAVALNLNGVSHSVPLWQFTAGVRAVALDGAAGADRLVSDVPYTFTGSTEIHLNGGDGDDYLAGGSACHSLNGGAGDDLIVGGDGRNFINGGDGNDTLFGHGYALDGHGSDPTYDLLNGGAGDNVVHGGAMGWAVSGEGNDLVFDGFATSLRVQHPEGGTAPYTAGDPLLASAGGATATLVGDVLVITGTSVDDQVTFRVEGSGNSARLAVTVNRTTTTFNRSAVKRYAFDARGGRDQLTLDQGGGRLELAGWTVRTANPDDGVVLSVAGQPPSGGVGSAPLVGQTRPTREERVARRLARQAELAVRRQEAALRRAQRRAERQAARDAAREQKRQERAESGGAVATVIPLMPAGVFSTRLITGGGLFREVDDLLLSAL